VPCSNYDIYGNASHLLDGRKNNQTGLFDIPKIEVNSLVNHTEMSHGMRKNTTLHQKGQGSSLDKATASPTGLIGQGTGNLSKNTLGSEIEGTGERCCIRGA